MQPTFSSYTTKQQPVVIISSVSGDIDSFQRILQFSQIVRVEHHQKEKVDKKICIWIAPANTTVILCGNVIRDKNVLLQDFQLVRCIASLKRQAERKKSKLVWLLGDNEVQLLDKKHCKSHSYDAMVKEELELFHTPLPSCVFRLDKWFFFSQNPESPPPPPTVPFGKWKRILQQQLKTVQAENENSFSSLNKVYGDVFAFPAKDHLPNVPKAPSVSFPSTFLCTDLNVVTTTSRYVQEDDVFQTISADMLKNFPPNPYEVFDSYQNSLKILQKKIFFSVRPSFLVVPNVSRQDIEVWVLH